MKINKQYGKLSADDLRILLSLLPMLEKEHLEMIQLRDEKLTKIFPENSPMPTWCHFYEMPHAHHFDIILTHLGAAEDLTTIFKSDNPATNLDSYIKNQDYDKGEDFESTPEELPILLQSLLALTHSLIYSLRSLMIHGQYINQLVAIARESNTTQKKKDNALLQAINIDTSVIGCSTAIKRISRAVLMDDVVFLKALKKAMFTKIDLEKYKNYQKIRYVLQILHESGHTNLNDKDLKELFVHQLNLYSDSQMTSEKNLGEFARKFKKQKSTI
jgi:hypothetical protein